MINTVDQSSSQITSPKPEAINSHRSRISSESLFANHNEIIIVHQGDEYRLRITSNNKLILTK